MKLKFEEKKEKEKVSGMKEISKDPLDLKSIKDLKKKYPTGTAVFLSFVTLSPEGDKTEEKIPCSVKEYTEGNAEEGSIGDVCVSIATDTTVASGDAGASVDAGAGVSESVVDEARRNSYGLYNDPNRPVQRSKSYGTNRGRKTFYIEFEDDTGESDMVEIEASSMSDALHSFKQKYGREALSISEE